jgi:hypothetical protein
MNRIPSLWRQDTGLYAGRAFTIKGKASLQDKSWHARVLSGTYDKGKGLLNKIENFGINTAASNAM